MFDLGWAELLVIGIVALIVVGPKDLPVLFRRVGQFVGKAKGMAREFSQAMNDAADESGVREVGAGINKSLKAATNPLGTAMDEVKSATKSLTNLDPGSETGKLVEKRAEDVKKIQDATARTTAERKQREATETVAKAGSIEVEVDPAPVVKPAAKPTPKKAPAKKAPAAKAPAKKAPAKTAAVKKPAAKKPAAKKTPATSTAAKKPAAKKPASKKSTS